MLRYSKATRRWSNNYLISFINQKRIIFLMIICTENIAISIHNLCMKYIDSKKLSDSQFKRYTGISWATFYLMLEQLKKHVTTKGRRPKLSVEDQVLLCLSYWREYRTLFHIATSYGVSEPTASRIVRHVEDCLIKSNLFNLQKNLPEN